MKKMTDAELKEKTWQLHCPRGFICKDQRYAISWFG